MRDFNHDNSVVIGNCRRPDLGQPSSRTTKRSALSTERRLFSPGVLTISKPSALLHGIGDAAWFAGYAPACLERDLQSLNGIWGLIGSAFLAWLAGA